MYPYNNIQNLECTPNHFCTLACCIKRNTLRINNTLSKYGLNIRISKFGRRKKIYNIIIQVTKKHRKNTEFLASKSELQNHQFEWQIWTTVFLRRTWVNHNPSLNLRTFSSIYQRNKVGSTLSNSAAAAILDFCTESG